MRILHTADWHLGNSIHSVDRTEEERSFLTWLHRLIVDKEIEALVVAGDIFDTFTPTISAQNMYYSFLASLINTKCRNVIIVGGNHDSGKMLEAPKDILNAINVRVVGRIENKNIDDMVFELKSSDNRGLICAAVPFINDLELRKYYDLSECAEGEASDQAYTKIYNSFLESAEKIRAGRDIPMIATGHLYAAGLEGRYEGKEKEERTDDGVSVLDVVGNLGKVHLSCFPDAFDYVALGHIHYKTRVAKSDRVMYSGSPFVMGYDDSDIDHYVIMLDVGDAESTHIIKPEFITVPEWIRFKRIPGTKEKIIEKVTNLINSEEEDTRPLYLELYYNPEDGAYLEEQIEKMDFPDHIKIVSWHIKKKENRQAPAFDDYDINSIQSIKAEDVVKQLILSKRSLSEEQKSTMTDEEISKYEEDIVNKYMPYFMNAFDEVSKEASDEDN